MLFLIVGRTSRGKDTLADFLKKDYDWTFIKSKTNRPKRTPDENTHEFLTNNEMKAINQNKKAAYTRIGKYEYCVTIDQIEKADGYIVDPLGIKTLCETTPDIPKTIVYIESDNDEAFEHAILRGNPEIEANKFYERSKAEDDQFTKFENDLKNNNITFPTNCNIITFHNNYEERNLHLLADQLNSIRKFHINMMHILTLLKNTNLLHMSEKNPDNMLIYNQEKAKQDEITLSQASLLIQRHVSSNEQLSFLEDIIYRYLSTFSII